MLRGNFIICSPYLIPNGQLPSGGHTFEEYETLLSEMRRVNALKPFKARRAQAPKARAKPTRKYRMEYQRRGRLAEMQEAAYPIRDQRNKRAARLSRGPAVLHGPWIR
jgi:hypothetical protein